MGIKKSPRGEISIENFRSRIRLRWRHAGERYVLNLPYACLPENMHHATVKVAEIKLDILKGGFDTSLEKYNSRPSKPAIQPNVKPAAQVELATILGQLVTLFNEWGKNIRNVDVDNSIDYLYVRRYLKNGRQYPCPNWLKS